MRRFLTAAAAATLMTVAPLGAAVAQEVYPPGPQEPEVLPTSVEQEPTEDAPAEGDDAADDDTEVRGLVLSDTGLDSTMLALLGAGTVVAGAGALVLARRGRQ